MKFLKLIFVAALVVAAVTLIEAETDEIPVWETYKGLKYRAHVLFRQCKKLIPQMRKGATDEGKYDTIFLQKNILSSRN